MSEGKDMVLVGITAIKETLTALSLPGASILEKAVDRVYERRRAAAREIYLEILASEGPDSLQFEEGEVDDLIQMMMRFAKASLDGAARQNLKLLAKVIFGLKRNRALEFDRFQTYANVLETLTRDEILFLGRMYRFYTDNPDTNDFLAFKGSLSGTFEDAHASALAAALTRTGMLLPVSAWGSTSYLPAARLFEMCELAQIDRASE